MDTPGSLRALVTFIILLAVAMLGLRVAASERGRFKLIAGVGAVIGLAAIVTGLHLLFGATQLYGIHEVGHHPHLIGPLLNLNHLGCLMAIGTVVSIGLTAYTNQPSWLRAVWFAEASGCALLVVYSVSRGATLAMVIGAFVTIALAIVQRFAKSEQRTRMRFATGSLPIIVVAICVIIVVIHSSASSLEQKFETTTLQELQEPKSKFSAWRSSLRVIEEAPVFGIGRGAFEPYFTRLHESSGQLVFAHAENEYLQAVVDWGIVGAILLGLAAIWLAVVTIGRWRDGPLAAAAIGGLVVLLVQSIVDFGAELLGLAVPGVLLAATVAYVPLREVTGRAFQKAVAVRIALVIALVGGAVLLLTSVTTTVAEDHEHLAAFESRDQATIKHTIDEAITRHPLDYYGYAVAAELAFRHGDAAGVRLLNHAMRLNPTHGGLHKVAARRLRKSGHLEQAALEYGAALRFSELNGTLLEEIAKELPVELAAAAIPLDVPHPETMLATLVRAKREPVALAWLARVIKHHPNDPRACDVILRRVRELADGEAARIASGGCLGTITDAGARLALAQVSERYGRTSDALLVLGDIEHATGSLDERFIAWRALCETHRRLQDLDATSSCLQRLQAVPELSRNLRETVTSLKALVDAEIKARATPTPPSLPPSQ